MGYAIQSYATPFRSAKTTLGLDKQLARFSKLLGKQMVTRNGLGTLLRIYASSINSWSNNSQLCKN
uniref:Uncharacterized protein n=1 Tax=Anguilla anguilla TaxID=7936 RepID=A0A0E9PMI7_ANGAN